MDSLSVHQQAGLGTISSNISQGEGYVPEEVSITRSDVQSLQHHPEVSLAGNRKTDKSGRPQVDVCRKSMCVHGLEF